MDHLDLEVRDLAAGRPLEVTLAAAVLAPKQNLRLTLRAAPLPPTLVPLLTGLDLQVEPVDLSPLLPFLPASVGLKAGRLRADLKAALGGAVEGGSGPTSLKGTVAATGLAFAAQEGGKPFDVALEVDADGDAVAGDVRLGKLDLAVGPAALAGRGRLLGLRGDAPRAEGLELTARGLDLEALAALAPPLRRALGGATVAGPIGLTVRGGGTAGAQRVTLAVDLTPVRLAVPGELTKAAGAPATLPGHPRSGRRGPGPLRRGARPRGRGPAPGRHARQGARRRAHADGPRHRPLGRRRHRGGGGGAGPRRRRPEAHRPRRGDERPGQGGRLAAPLRGLGPRRAARPRQAAPPDARRPRPEPARPAKPAPKAYDAKAFAGLSGTRHPRPRQRDAARGWRPATWRCGSTWPRTRSRSPGRGSRPSAGR